MKRRLLTSPCICAVHRHIIFVWFSLVPCEPQRPIPFCPPLLLDFYRHASYASWMQRGFSMDWHSSASLNCRLYSMLCHILPKLLCSRSLAVGLLRSMTKKNPTHINGIKLTARDIFLARGKDGWLLLIIIRASKITVLVISQLLICHSASEITHLTHMVPFQEMTSKTCRPYYIIRMFLVEDSTCASKNYLCILLPKHPLSVRIYLDL